MGACEYLSNMKCSWDTYDGHWLGTDFPSVHECGEAVQADSRCVDKEYFFISNY